MKESLLKISLVQTSKLSRYENNARTHSDEQIGKIAASIKEFGFTNPILIDDKNEIIAGHGRLSAAQKLKLKQVPCIVLGNLSEGQKRALRLADNRIALDSGWDIDLLKLELNEIKVDFTELELIGFNDLELGVFLGDLTEAGAPNDEWQGMPEFNQDKTVHRKIVVSFLSEKDVKAFFKLLEQPYTPKTKSIWYPHMEKRDLASEAYE